MLSHDVYFTLKDACKKYLSNHPGTVLFGAGTLVEEHHREVNDRDFHVALHVVFEDKAAHDKYQDADAHQRFIEEFKHNWAKVRVFDSWAEGA